MEPGRKEECVLQEAPKPGTGDNALRTRAIRLKGLSDAPEEILSPDEPTARKKKSAYRRRTKEKIVRTFNEKQDIKKLPGAAGEMVISSLREGEDDNPSTQAAEETGRLAENAVSAAQNSIYHRTRTKKRQPSLNSSWDGSPKEKGGNRQPAREAGHGQPNKNSRLYFESLQPSGRIYFGIPGAPAKTFIGGDEPDGGRKQIRLKEGTEKTIYHVAESKEGNHFRAESPSPLLTNNKSTQVLNQADTANQMPPDNPKNSSGMDIRASPENWTGNGKVTSKNIQRKRIKKAYADAYKGKYTTKTVEESGKKTYAGANAIREGYQKAGVWAVDFIRRNAASLAVAGAVVCLFAMVVSGASTVSVMLSEAGAAFAESTYLSSDEDILGNDKAYLEMETKLQEQLDNIESTYGGYDEYRYQVDEISHDPYALASYFTARYGNYKAEDISPMLPALFQSQYTLTLEETVETRTRTVTDSETGEEYEEEYEWYVLNVTLENKGVDAVAKDSLTGNQLSLYQVYQSSLGNRSYLFGEHQIAGNVSGGGLSYEVPPEALEDEAFSRMIQEAEKYLGMPYVWGGSSPGTGFDCSGFVSWVINHSGNGWNVGRQTANGLMGNCTYVAPGEARPGDLIFFEKTYNTSGASHVGIYVGNGMMLHCGNPIQYASVESNYWKQHFLSFGRIN